MNLPFLAAAAAVASLLCLTVALTSGSVAGYAALAVGLFNSIMFPTIFALSIHGLGAQTKRASSYLVMAIIGGAIFPKIMGHIADVTDLSRSFIVPAICFAIVAFYGWMWPRYSRGALHSTGV